MWYVNLSYLCLEFTTYPFTDVQAHTLFTCVCMLKQLKEHIGMCEISKDLKRTYIYLLDILLKLYYLISSAETDGEELIVPKGYHYL
mgnify:CR=1 FL=1